MLSWRERRRIVEDEKLRSSAARGTSIKASKIGSIVAKVLEGTKFLVDVAVPVALVFFAVKTDKIQSQQILIQDAQRLLAEKQNTLISDQNTIQKHLDAISSLQNKAEIGFRIIVDDKLAPPTEALSVVIVNNGAPVHGVSVYSFSYLEMNYTFSFSDDHGGSIPVIRIENGSATSGNTVGEIATVLIAYNRNFLSGMRKKLSDYDSYAVRDDNRFDGLNKYLKDFDIKTVVEVVVNNRDDSYTRSFYDIAKGQWKKISYRAAEREYVRASSASIAGLSLVYAEKIEDSDFVDFYRAVSQSAGCPFAEQIYYLPSPVDRDASTPASKILGFSETDMLGYSWDLCDLRKPPTNLRKDFYSLTPPEE